MACNLSSRLWRRLGPHRLRLAQWLMDGRDPTRAVFIGPSAAVIAWQGNIESLVICGAAVGMRHHPDGSWTTEFAAKEG